MEIKKAYVKENNGGGLQIDCYDNNNNICVVIAGLEMCDPETGIDDLKGIVDGDWDYTDASEWYDAEDNSAGDLRDGTDEPLTAADIEDTTASSSTIAEYDGKTMVIYYSEMGHAGQRYFGDPSEQN